MCCRCLRERKVVVKGSSVNVPEKEWERGDVMTRLMMGWLLMMFQRPLFLAELWMKLSWLHPAMFWGRFPWGFLWRKKNPWPGCRPRLEWKCTHLPRGCHLLGEVVWLSRRARHRPLTPHRGFGLHRGHLDRTPCTGLDQQVRRSWKAPGRSVPAEF